MVVTAALGTLWYLYLELQNNDFSAVGWSVVAVVWFVVLRRLFHLWRAVQRRNNDEQ